MISTYTEFLVGARCRRKFSVCGGAALDREGDRAVGTILLQALQESAAGPGEEHSKWRA